MRILHVAPSFYPNLGGIENYVLNLCLQLMAKGHKCEVLTLRKTRTKEALPAEDFFDKIKISRISNWGPERFKVYPSLSKYICGFDVLHVHELKNLCNYLIFARKRHKTPVVISTHGGFFHTNKFASLKKMYFQTVLPAVLKRADRVIAVSDSDYNIFHKICSNITAIPNGIDYALFSKVRKNVQPNTCLYYGRLSENKRVDSLIKAVSCLRKEIPDIRLDIAGPDWQNIRANLETQVKKNDLQHNVVFAGEVGNEKLFEYMGRSHLFVSASEYEGFGITVLEAMASGTITVVNNIKPLNGFIQNGINGFLTDFSHPHEAAKTIKNILSMPRQQQNLVENRAKVTARLFAWETIVQRIENLYEEVMLNRRN